MSQIVNIYCDESCHLADDHQKVMVLGALWCPTDKAREIAERIRDSEKPKWLRPPSCPDGLENSFHTWWMSCLKHTLTA